MTTTMASYAELDTRGDRVREHTATIVNERLDGATQATVEECTRRGRDAVVARLAELDREWDIDRTIIAMFAVLGGASFAGGLARYSRRSLLEPRRTGLFYLFGAQLGFLLLHAFVGWCPPVSLLRRLGVRTSREIEAERRSLQRWLVDEMS